MDAVGTQSGGIDLSMLLASRLDEEAATKFQDFLTKAQEFSEDLEDLESGDIDEELFDKVDANDDGEITAEERAEFVRNGLEELSGDLQELLFALLGLDENGGGGAPSGGKGGGKGSAKESGGAEEGGQSEETGGSEEGGQPEESGAPEESGEAGEAAPASETKEIAKDLAEGLRTLADGLRELAANAPDQQTRDSLNDLADQLDSAANIIDPSGAEGGQVGSRSTETNVGTVLLEVLAKLGEVQDQIEGLENDGLI